MTKQVSLNSPSTSYNISPTLYHPGFFLQHRYPFVAISAHACITLSFPRIHLRIYLSRASLDLDILLSRCTDVFVPQEFDATSTTRANGLTWHGFVGPDMVKVALSVNDCEKEEEQEGRGMKGRERRSDEVMGQLSTSSTFPDIPSTILCWVKLLFKVGAK